MRLGLDIVGFQAVVGFDFDEVGADAQRHAGVADRV